MYDLYKSIIVTMLCYVVTCDAHEYILKAPSQTGCEAQAACIQQKIAFTHYVRAAAMTAATTYTLYSCWHWITSPAPTQGSLSPAQELISVQEQSSWNKWGVWFLSSGKRFTQLCAQQLLINWVLAQVITDQSPRAFIQRRVAYKYHLNEIDKLLQQLEEYAAPHDHENTICLINAHLQMLIDKFGLLMAYYLYYADAEASDEHRALLTSYVSLQLAAVADEVTLFNKTVQQNFSEAVIHTKKVLHELLCASVQYGLAAMSLDL